MRSSDITLTKKLRAQLINLKNAEPQPDEDAPEITDWSQAQVGKFYRPIKKQITLRLDADTLSWFKNQVPRYQTLINKICRDYMEQHQHA